MPPPLTTQTAASAHATPATLADSHWPAFRRRQDTELQEFQEHVKMKRIMFERDVQVEREGLLARHKKEEDNFWRTIHEIIERDAKAGSRSGDIATKVSSKMNTTEKPRREGMDTMVDVDKDPMKTAKAPGVSNKKVEVTIIDLCSDEDEDEPAPSTELTSSGPQSGNTEKPAATQEAATCSIPSVTLEPLSNKPMMFVELSQPSKRETPHTLPSPSVTEPSTLVMPATPSTTTDEIPAARAVCVSPQASTTTIRASSPTKTQRNTSAAFGFSSSSSTTNAKGGKKKSHAKRSKKKVPIISGDKDKSNYMPPSVSDDEEEPASLIGAKERKRVAKDERETLASRPVFKKPRTEAKTDGSAFNPRTHPQQKAKVNDHQPALSTPETLTAKIPTSVSKEATKATHTVPLRPSSQRSSKSIAQSKIDLIIALEDAYRKSSVGVQAKTEEFSECSAIEDVRGRLGSVSLTPAPSSATENVESPIKPEISGGIDVTSGLGCKGRNEDGKSWTIKRTGGDRHLAKTYGDESPQLEGKMYDIKQDEQWQSRTTRK